MTIIETWLNQDINEAVKVRYIDGNMFSMDNGGNRINVTVMDGDSPATLSGTVSANVIRSDGSTVAVTGTYSGNTASVVLSQSCYVIPGVISIVVKITDSTTVTTIAAVVANVYQSTTDTVVDPGTIIPSIETLIAQINAAVASIPADYSDLWASIAPNYAYLSFPVGTGYLCTYNGHLYRAKGDIASSEAWTADHWAQINIGDYLFEMKSAMNHSIDIAGANLLAISDFDTPTDSNVSYSVSGSKITITNSSTATYAGLLTSSAFLAKISAGRRYRFHARCSVSSGNGTPIIAAKAGNNYVNPIFIGVNGGAVVDFEVNSNTSAIALMVAWGASTSGSVVSFDELWVKEMGQDAVARADISDLKSAIDYITENGKNLLPVWNKTTPPSNVTVTYTPGKIKLYGTSNGGSVSYDYSACEPITLPAGTYTFSRDTAALQQILRKVSGTSTTNVAVLQGSTNSVTFTLSETTTLYLYIGGFVSGTSYNREILLQIESGSSATYWVTPVLSAIDVIARGNAEHKTRLSLEWTSGKAFVYNAGWSNNSGWSYADVILTQGESIIVSLDVSTTVYPLSVWSDDGNSIIKTCFPVADSAGYKTLTYTCTSDKERLRINVLSANKGNVVAEKYNVGDLLNKSNIEAGKNSIPCYDVLYNSIIAVGDSLTQGSYTGYDLHPTQSYPAFLAKMMGCDVENAGRAGWTTLEWFVGDATSHKGFPYYDYSDYDAAVICLGTNGGLEDVVDQGATSTTNTGAYCSIIEGMRTQNPNINIFLCNLWTSGGSGGSALANQVIGEIAEKYSLPVIDLRSEFIALYGAYRAVQNNIHLGRIGYAKMAGIIREKLNDYVITNPTKYNYIPT